MLQFELPGLEDREWIQPLLSATGKMGSEYAFGTLFIWRESFSSKVCRLGDDTFVSFNSPRHTYKSPLKTENFLEMMEVMLADAKERGIPFKMWGATREETELLEQKYPGRLEYSAERDGCDYIYKASDLINLSGRKYHGKRNHIAQFEKRYNWSYEDLTLENLADCRAIAEEWRAEQEDQSASEAESHALAKALDHFSELALAGGMIRVDGKPVAFTIGEEINPKTYLLHFEKALDGYEGLYTMINHEYASRHLGSYEYINREEDMGLEGLRKAKLSYHPAILLEKYFVTEKKSEDAEK